MSSVTVGDRGVVLCHTSCKVKATKHKVSSTSQRRTPVKAVTRFPKVWLGPEDPTSRKGIQEGVCGGVTLHLCAVCNPHLYYTKHTHIAFTCSSVFQEGGGGRRTSLVVQCTYFIFVICRILFREDGLFWMASDCSTTLLLW